VQLYISAPTGGISVPRRELKGFEKISLEASEAIRVHFELESRAFSHWDVVTKAWVVAGGRYFVEIGRSAHDIVVSEPVELVAPRVGRLTLDSRVSDFLGHPVTGPILARAVAGVDDGDNTNLLEMVASMPMRRLMRFPGVGDSLKRVGVLIAVANNPVVRGLASVFRRR
jgi:beta-glucosidase